MTLPLPAKPARKTKEERIAERKAQRRAEEASNVSAAQVEPLSDEEKLAEKLRLQKIQQDADLAVAKELFGGKEDPAPPPPSVVEFVARGLAFSTLYLCSNGIYRSILGI